MTLWLEQSGIPCWRGHILLPQNAAIPRLQCWCFQCLAIQKDPPLKKKKNRQENKHAGTFLFGLTVS